MSEVSVPDLSLVVLVGASGSGKSTFAARHFGPFEVVSSDTCRGLVADDVNDQAASADAFEVLHHIAGVRLRRGRLTVVDATNVQADARRQLVALAREHDVLPVAVVLDLPERVCVERNAARPDRDLGAGVVRRHHDALRRSLRSLRREGFRAVHVLSSVAEVEAAVVTRHPLRSDLRGERGPFDVVGDVHGCRSELESLLGRLGYEVTRDEQGRPVDAAHPQGRRAVFVGDLVDRGPDSPGVLRLVMGMVAAGHALAVPGNHEAKLVRALSPRSDRGRGVTLSHGLETTMAQLAGDDDASRAFREQVRTFCDALVSHLVLDGGKLVVAHAGLKEAYHNRASGRVRSFALYGDTTGESDEHGLPVRLDWAQDYRGSATVVYGHVPTTELEWVNRTICLDTGCVFGGRLSALRYPERETVSVPAEAVHYEPAKPLGPSRPAGGAGAPRDDDDLAITDVLGRRSVQTRLLGRVAVEPEQAAGALEVMSRFAVDPHLLWYLPATMAPAPSWPDHPDLLEHPLAAFEAYRRTGVTDLLCEEKHMGSRAVVLVARSPEGLAAWTTGGGVVHTRTGRSFFGPDLSAQLLARVRAAVETAGLWDELCGAAGEQWLLLDAELLPWSAKAEELLREQYAAVGAAARAGLPPSVQVLEGAAARGLDVGALLGRTRARQVDAESFTRAYRRYVWPTGVAQGSLDGVQLAPFQVLAASSPSSGGGAPVDPTRDDRGSGAQPVTRASSTVAGGGRVFSDRDHGWHLGVADRLVAADGELFRTTRRLRVDAADAASCEAGAAWWTRLTDGAQPADGTGPSGGGGEGMVVKPFAGAAARGGKGLAQPGTKVRGREYLRLVYGPGYTEPAAMERLRQRQLGRKRSMALREHALGHEALARLADGEPLWRVHEAVFAVLALESEPVDPRL